MAIPKNLHFIWAGGSRLLPEENAQRIKAWAAKNPGFETVLWVDKETKHTLPLKNRIKGSQFHDIFEARL